jgi:deazaflavin-dependent oxidoreductase (nitroreductase family)
MSLADEPFVYVTTTGHKTGLPRTIEIWFISWNGCIYILAEHGRRAKWVMNIVANARVEVKLAHRTFVATARVLDETADAEAWTTARDRAREKYGWGDGLPVEIRPETPLDLGEGEGQPGTL